MQIKSTDETCFRNVLDENTLFLQSKFLLQELHKGQTILKKLLNNILSNSDQVKTVKHHFENQTQKVQHEEKEQKNYLKLFNKPSKKLTHRKESIKAM